MLDVIKVESLSHLGLQHLRGDQHSPAHIHFFFSKIDLYQAPINLTLNSTIFIGFDESGVPTSSLVWMELLPLTNAGANKAVTSASAITKLNKSSSTKPVRTPCCRRVKYFYNVSHVLLSCVMQRTTKLTLNFFELLLFFKMQTKVVLISIVQFTSIA